MGLQTYTTAQYVQNWIANFCSSLEITPNFVPGDIELGLAEADGGQANTLQLQCAQVIKFARATTSTGADLDSFYAQFAFPREQATPAIGTVTFSTSVANLQVAYVPVGTIVQNVGASIQYIVIADSQQPTFNASLQAYVLPAGELTLNATAQSIGSGNSFNVQANTLIQIQNTLFGISQVTNLGSIQSGRNTETDAQYRARFIAYISNLSKATYGALLAAVEAVQQGLKIALYGNVRAISNPPTGLINPYDGNVLALIDDGSGSPPAGLLTAVSVTIGNTIAFPVRWQVYRPAIIIPAFAIALRIDPDFVSGTVILAVQAAIVAWVNALPIGAVIYWSELIEQAFTVDGVDSVQPGSAKIDGSEADLDLNLWEEALVTGSNVAVTSV